MLLLIFHYHNQYKVYDINYYKTQPKFIQNLNYFLLHKIMDIEQ